MSQEHLKKKDENQSTLVSYISHEVAKEFCFVFYPRFDVFSRRKKKDSWKRKRKKKKQARKTKKKPADARKKKQKEKAEFWTRHNPLRHDLLQISEVQRKDDIDL